VGQLHKEVRILNIRHLSIRSQLVILLSLVIGLFLIASVVTYQALGRARQDFTQFIKHDQQLLLQFTELYANGLQMGQALRNIILDPANPKAPENFDKAAREMDDLLTKANDLAQGQQAIVDDLAKVVQLREQQKGVQKEIRSLVSSGQIDQAKMLLNQNETPVWRQMRQLIMDQIKSQKQAIEASEAEVSNHAANAQLTSLLLSLAAVAAGVGIGLLIIANIVGRLRDLTASIENLAQGDGDLTARLPIGGNNELGMVAAALNRFIAGLQDLVNRIKSHAGQLEQLSSQLALTSSSLRQSSHNESNAVTSTASSIEEMSSSIASVADGTEQVRRVSKESAQYSDQARAQMIELKGAMSSAQVAVQGMSGSVGQFLESTTSIIGATQHVKDIADQINLLALNAAIEAARAGEQGRGFAVVADEVRKLAEKTALYANEISQITSELGGRSSQVEAAIRDGEAALEASAKCSETAADIIGQAHSSVIEATRGIEEIANSTREQSLASSQISSNVETLADIANSTEHAIEQSDRTVQEMKQLADALNAVAARFRT
jgi:methyl-accepting chemotaxis protein